MAEVSIRYGKALYDLTVVAGTLNDCFDQAIAARDVLELPECRRVLAHPHISREEKNAFVQGVLSETLHVHLRDFFALLISKNRARDIPDALEAFIQMGMRWRGEVEAHVVSAVELRDDQLEALRVLLAKKLNKQVDLTWAVDPDLIGGFYIEVDGHFIDRTVRKQIQDMKLEMGRG